MLKFTLLGTGGMMPLPERGLASAMAAVNGRQLLIDCGEGTQVQIRRFGLGFKAIDGVLITHFHGDHVSGLPGLLLSMGNSGREAPLTLAGPVGLNHVADCLRVIAPELPFEVVYREIDPDAPEPFACAGLDIAPFPLKHGMPCPCPCRCGACSRSSTRRRWTASPTPATWCWGPPAGASPWSMPPTPAPCPSSRR